MLRFICLEAYIFACKGPAVARKFIKKHLALAGLMTREQCQWGVHVCSLAPYKMSIDDSSLT